MYYAVIVLQNNINSTHHFDTRIDYIQKTKSFPSLAKAYFFQKGCDRGVTVVAAATAAGTPRAKIDRPAHFSARYISFGGQRLFYVCTRVETRPSSGYFLFFPASRPI